MAAGANPTGNRPVGSAFNGVSTDVNGDSDNSQLAHIPAPGIATDWSSDELVTLEEGINKFSKLPSVIRYAKIAMTLPDKTVRDVALRCRFMNKKEVSKRRKDDPSRKSRDKRERVSEPSPNPSHLPSQPGNHPYPVPHFSIDDDGVSFEAIGGPIGQLLELNVQTFQKISANFSSYQFQENINLFCQAQDSLVKVLNSLTDAPEIMNQMPPFPVKLNEELVNSVLPSTSHLTR